MIRISLGVGIVTGVALIYAARVRNRNRSLLARTTRQAHLVKDRASKVRKSATGFMEKGFDEAYRRKKGFLEAVDAGKAAWQKVTG
jgi:hypothetical protein